jgi:hypothetical protein
MAGGKYIFCVLFTAPFIADNIFMGGVIWACDDCWGWDGCKCKVWFN